MEKIHIRNLFRILVPSNRNLGSALPRNNPFGLDFLDYPFRFNIKLVGTDHFGNIKHEPTDCFTWAKRNPVIFQQTETNEVTGMFIRVKINQGVFDFRRTKDRLFQIIVEFLDNGSIIKTGTSRIWELFPKRRYCEKEDDEDETVVPIYWLGEDGYLMDNQQEVSPIETGSISPSGNSQYVSPEVPSSFHTDHHPVGPQHTASSKDESPNIHEMLFEDAVIDAYSPVEDDQYSMVVRADYARSDENYMVLYNGNAEVVGNFRALNFYKASDINIKEDIRLLEEDGDSRAALLKINGMSYKFKKGVSDVTNRRFIGYIAQQIESVVPEAVQLIDGILHVDYESLIPYLSESIKQNYSDIKNVSSEVDRIRLVVDQLYEQFTRGTKQRAQSERATSSATNSRKTMGWILGSAACLILVASLAIAYIIFAGQTIVANGAVPLTGLVPAIPRSGLEHLSPANYERGMLLELYDSIWANDTFFPWNLTAHHCTWFGITCNATTGRVIWMALSSFAAEPRSDMTRTIPAIIGNFTELRSLDLMDNNITSTIPESMTNLKNLVYLRLSINPLVGTLPDLTRLDRLAEVDISLTLLSLNGSSLAMLMQLPAIHSILIESVPINAELPLRISSSLDSIVLNDCNLNGTIPKSWEDSNITQLHLLHNKLTGSIPCFGKSLSGFMASYNNFDGEFCGSRLGPNLIDLIVSNTKLTGVFDLPNVDMKHLYALDISKNQFTSFMPSAMRAAEGPVHCSAAGNPLKCPVPDWAQSQCQAVCSMMG